MIPILLIVCIWKGYSTCFSLGNSNSLSTIDVAGGYVGACVFVTKYKNSNTISLFISGLGKENLIFSAIAITFNYSSPYLIWILTFLLATRKLQGYPLTLNMPQKVKYPREDTTTIIDVAHWQHFLLDRYRNRIRKAGVLASFLAGSVGTVMVWFAVLLVVFRHHLFVWSVFAPKFFYLLFFCTLLEVTLTVLAAIVLLANK